MITRREANVALFSTIMTAAMPGLAMAESQAMELPPPQTEGGKPLMEALKARHSSREYADRSLPLQVLSNLLWAAWGINRPGTGLRTAPSSQGKMDIDLYLSMANGVWIYDPKAHQLLQQALLQKWRQRIADNMRRWGIANSRSDTRSGTGRRIIGRWSIAGS